MRLCAISTVERLEGSANDAECATEKRKPSKQRKRESEGCRSSENGDYPHNALHSPNYVKEYVDSVVWGTTVVKDRVQDSCIYSWLCPCVCVRTYVCDGNRSHMRALPDVL